MPVTAEFTEEGRGFVLCGSGIVTAPEMLEIKQDLVDHPERIQNLISAVIDLQDVTEAQFSAQDIRKFAELDAIMARTNHDIAVAVVAPQAHVFGLARMWEVFVEPTRWETNVFHTRAEAHAWLEERTRQKG